MSGPAQAFKAAILTALGHAPEVIEPGKLHRFPTSGKRGDSAGWAKLFADLRGGVFGCNRSGVSETWQADRDRPMTPVQRAELARQIAQATAERERQQRARWAENARRIKDLWSQCVPLTPGDPVTMYLKRRGFAGVWPLPQCLRCHRGLPYWDGAEKLGTFPAMVAPLVAPDGRTVALHRTFVTRDGSKAGVPTAKKLTPAAGLLAGASVPLHQPRAGVIGIAEGIETALGAWCASALPVVAAYSAGNLAAWRWPAGVQRIVVFSDHDMAGREAADTLRARAIGAGLRCEVMAPTDPGSDWADVWLGRDAALIGNFV